MIHDHPMRPLIRCSHCGRYGAVQRRVGIKPIVEHRCPGPFTLAAMEEDDARNPTFRMTTFPTPYLGLGGDWIVTDADLPERAADG